MMVEGKSREAAIRSLETWDGSTVAPQPAENKGSTKRSRRKNGGNWQWFARTFNNGLGWQSIFPALQS
jgi:hypothetical protein